jgi:UDP-2-acetamido-3-amino-2,3-dideoxy-glucuronate N-acetyltransferase
MSYTVAEGSFVEPGTIIGDGTTIHRNCVIEAGGGKYPQTRIGKHVCIQNLSSITAGIVIEDDVFIGPGVITINTREIKWGRTSENLGKREPPVIKRGARIGGGAKILAGVVIGEEAEIGMGAVVVKDCDAFGRYVGNPARKIGEVPMEKRYAS